MEVRVVFCAEVRAVWECEERYDAAELFVVEYCAFGKLDTGSDLNRKQKSEVSYVHTRAGHGKWQPPRIGALESGEGRTRTAWSKSMSAIPRMSGSLLLTWMRTESGLSLRWVSELTDTVSSRSFVCSGKEAAGATAEGANDMGVSCGDGEWLLDVSAPRESPVPIDVVVCSVLIGDNGCDLSDGDFSRTCSRAGILTWLGGGGLSGMSTTWSRASSSSSLLSWSRCASEARIVSLAPRPSGSSSGSSSLIASASALSPCPGLSSSDIECSESPSSPSSSLSLMWYAGEAGERSMVVEGYQVSINSVRGLRKW